MVAGGGRKTTKYFHASCNKKRRANHIQRLKNDNEEWISWDEGLQDLIKDYYQQLFTEGLNQGDKVVNYVSTNITTEHNTILLELVTDDEVKKAIFSMHPEKAPGLTA